MSSLKTVMRSAKNMTLGYSDVQIKTRQATCNDAWGPSGSLMAELASLSHHSASEIISIVDKRLNDSGKNWRHVYKALILLEYLIEKVPPLTQGADSIVQHAKQNLHVIKTLKDFQFIDEDRRDQGMNVREKSKQLALLLASDSRIQELRSNTRSVNYSGSAIQNSPTARPGDDEEMRAAMEASTRQLQIDEERRRGNIGSSALSQEDRDLQRALELSEREAIDKRLNARDRLSVTATSNQDDIIDFFGSLESLPNPNQDAYSGFGGVDPFAQQQQMQYEQEQMMLAQQQQQQFLQQQALLQQQQQQQMQQQQMQQQQMQQQYTGNPFGQGQNQQVPQFAKPQPTPLQFTKPASSGSSANPNLTSNLVSLDPFANTQFPERKQPGDLVNLDGLGNAPVQKVTNPFSTQNANPFHLKSGGANMGQPTLGQMQQQGANPVALQPRQQLPFNMTGSSQPSVGGFGVQPFGGPMGMHATGSSAYSSPGPFGQNQYPQQFQQNQQLPFVQQQQQMQQQGGFQVPANPFAQQSRPNNNQAQQNFFD